MQYWHFLKAEARALKPPTAQAARLSAEKMVTVPRQEKDVSATLNSTPSSCKSSIQIVLHAIKGRVSFPLHIKHYVYRMYVVIGLIIDVSLPVPASKHHQQQVSTILQSHICK